MTGFKNEFVVKVEVAQLKSGRKDPFRWLDASERLWCDMARLAVDLLFTVLLAATGKALQTADRQEKGRESPFSSHAPLRV